MAGIYIHIPFCSTRCIYCDFYTTTKTIQKKEYVDSLISEMKLRKDYLNGEKISTIYFGGGTPSLLSFNDFEKIFAAIDSLFVLSGNPEITLEANPDDLTANYVYSLGKLPFNRISIGIQSFVDEELRFLRRRHNADEAEKAVMLCKKTGFNNISIDLMFGLPDQTEDSWRYSLYKAVSLDVEHISAYDLSYETGTPIYVMYEKGSIKPLDEETGRLFFLILNETLTNAGFVHYEVSNFAKSTLGYPYGMISKHNSSYWNGTNYMGIGAAAHSYNTESRSWNISSVSDYIDLIGNGLLPSETEYLDRRTNYNDFIITRLRTIWGVSLDEMENKLGVEWRKYFLKQIESLLIINKLKIEGVFVKIACEDFIVSDAIIRYLIAT
jgi:oxygen-independent coproporphyrinogen-3 oxidase